MSDNKYFSAVTQQADVKEAVTELAQAFKTDGPGEPPDLLVVFVSSHFDDQLPDLISGISDAVAPRNFVGCTGQGIVHNASEIEDDPCVSVWAAWFHGTNVGGAACEVAHVTYDRSSGGFKGLPKQIDEQSVSLLALAEPYTFPADVFLERINTDFPGLHVVGGMASGGMGPGESKLILNGTVLSEGAVVVALDGVPMKPIVSQGCRPIGEHFVITKAEQNEILELGGVKAHQRLKAVYDRLPTRDKDLMRLGFHIGRVVNEYQDSFSYGDFLIRNVTGMNSENESVIIGDYFRPGQTVQFHVRDAMTADEDLRQMLKQSEPDFTPQAALLFTCNGRGSRFFENPDHDALALQNQYGSLPVAGFFCQGEMGPVGGVNFLHGYTASVVVFG